MTAKATILVVEDEPLVSMALQEDLTGLGYHVPEIVAKGDDVAAAMQRITPQLILMDIHLKGTMDGVEAVSLLRQHSDVPVLFLTAHSDSATIKRAADCLPDGYLLKPYNERELAANVEMALRKASSPRRREKSMDKLLPLVQALDESLCLFDEEGEWLSGNAGARRDLDMASVGPGLPLYCLIGLPEIRFRLDPKSIGGQEYDHHGKSLAVESLFDRTGRLQGFICRIDPMNKVERGHLRRSAPEVNAAISALLPRNGRLGKNLNCAGFLLPSPSGTGDFYDVFPISHGQYVFYNLDVMGHGPLPAMVAYAMIGTIRDLAASYPDPAPGRPSPHDLLQELNRKFATRPDTDIFFTITLGVIDPKRGDYSLCRAGHTQSIQVDRKGNMKLIHTEGSALGAFVDVELEEFSGWLEPGERLILLSDGVVDAMAKMAGRDGYQVLAAKLKAHAGADTEELVQALLTTCRSADELRDTDLSLLVLEPLHGR